MPCLLPLPTGASPFRRQETLVGQIFGDRQASWTLISVSRYIIISVLHGSAASQLDWLAMDTGDMSLGSVLVGKDGATVMDLTLE